MDNDVFRDAKGMYLAIDKCGKGYCIGWWDPEHKDFGSYLGESGLKEFYGHPEDTDEWEMWVSEKSVIADFELGGVLCWKTRDGASEAMRAANAALLEGAHTPWPVWAIYAKNAGWTPPSGWKP